MFNIFKSGNELTKLAKTMNKMAIMLQTLNGQLERDYDPSEFTETVLMLAYIAKKGIMDRIDENKFGLTSKIYVPEISKSSIAIMFAFSQTVGKLNIIAEQLDLTDEVQNILDGGNLYYEVENILPLELKKDI